MNIKALLDKQRELDMYIFKEKGLGDPYDKKWIEIRKLALLVEIGELANATRCFKYWSNKGPENKERILDETADCLHFCLSLMNFKTDLSELEEGSIKGCYKYFQSLIEMGYEKQPLEKAFNKLFQVCVEFNEVDVFTGICLINFTLGYLPEEIEQAYLKKHEDNYKRQQKGY